MKSEVKYHFLLKKVFITIRFVKIASCKITHAVSDDWPPVKVLDFTIKYLPYVQ